MGSQGSMRGLDFLRPLQIRNDGSEGEAHVAEVSDHPIGNRTTSTLCFASDSRNLTRKLQ